MRSCLQAAFLSTIVGVDVAEVAARAAVAAISDVGDLKQQGIKYLCKERNYNACTGFSL